MRKEAVPRITGQCVYQFNRVRAYKKVFKGEIFCFVTDIFLFIYHRQLSVFNNPGNMDFYTQAIGNKTCLGGLSFWGGVIIYEMPPSVCTWVCTFWIYVSVHVNDAKATKSYTFLHKFNMHLKYCNVRLDIEYNYGG